VSLQQQQREEELGISILQPVARMSAQRLAAVILALEEPLDQVLAVVAAVAVALDRGQVFFRA
jgi:hypothetical protein